MLCRSTTLRHPSGAALRTPLLVPSFSSKGARFDNKGKSEIKDVFRITAEMLIESMLVSAYDIRYGHLPKPDRFPFTPTLTFVDSGGYETGVDYDFSSVFRHNYKAERWDLNRLTSVLDSWPDRIPAVFVNFDKASAGKTVAKQIEDANKLFMRYPKHLHNFLLKPTRRCKGILSNTLNAAQTVITKLGTFGVIGVTEKELGHSMLDRMETVARLRMSLDGAGVAAPIQVFGALDTLSTCLYFLAGAEIFDGLTWLRYAYSEGKCVYPQNYGVLQVGIDQHDDYVQTKIFSDNYNELRRLQLSLKDFVSTKDFSKLQPYSEILRAANDSLVARIGGNM